MLKRLIVAAVLVPLTCCAADLDVRFAPGSLGIGEDFERELTRVLRGNPARIVASNPSGGSVRLETTETGLEALQSDPRLTSIRRLDTPAAAPAAALGFTQWCLSMTQAGLVVELSAARGQSGVAAPEARALRDGRLSVVARAADGQEIARVVVDDPRIVRYEGIDATGRFNERRDLPVATSGEIRVALPSDPRIKRIEIESGGNALAGAAVD